LALGAILVIGLGYRCWGLAWGLYDADISRRPHPDEWVVYWLFQWFDQTRSLNPCPRPQTHCYFDWGSVYLYLAYSVHYITTPLLQNVPAGLLGNRADPTFVRSVLAGRMTSVVTSTLTILVVYRTGVLAYGVAAGLVAALLVALSGLLIQLAHFGTPDSTTVFLVTVTLLVSYVAAVRPSRGSLALGGALVGLSAGTEYHMALLAVPLTVAWLLGTPRRTASILLAFACSVAAFVVSNPYAVLDLPAFLSALDHTVRIRTIESSLEYQDRFAGYGPDWLYVVRYPLGYGVGFAFAILMMAGALNACLQRRKIDLLLLSWIIPYALLVSIASAKFMRYSAPLLPPLALLAGGLLVQVLQLRKWVLQSLAAAALAFALLYSGTYDAAYAQLFNHPEPRYVATRWIQQHAPVGAKIAFEELPTGLVNMPYFVTSAGYLPCFYQFRIQRLDGPMQYLVLDSYTQEEHPSISGNQVSVFLAALSASKDYRLVMHVDYVPTLLGFQFPIAGSPHDWRYLTHDISIYLQVTPTGGTSLCYPNIDKAIAALYVQPQEQ
jgi:hypothetical protein